MSRKAKNSSSPSPRKRPGSTKKTAIGSRKRGRPFPFVAVAVAAVFLMGVRPYHSYDVWHHIRCGWYAAPWHHGPAATEPFSAPGRMLSLEWIQYEWLAQILIYLSHVHLGVAGTILAKAGLFALAFWMLAKAARARGAGRLAAALAVLAAGLAASPQFQVRPGVFTYLAFGAILWTLEKWRKAGQAHEPLSPRERGRGEGEPLSPRERGRGEGEATQNAAFAADTCASDSGPKDRKPSPAPSLTPGPSPGGRGGGGSPFSANGGFLPCPQAGTPAIQNDPQAGTLAPQNGTQAGTPAPQWVRLLVLPIVFALWANLHGAYVAGWVLLGIWAFSGFVAAYLPKWVKSRPAGPDASNQLPHPSPLPNTNNQIPITSLRLALALAACVAAVCLNPYGWRLLAVPFKLTTDATVRAGVMEWKPADWGIWLSPENLFIPLFAAAILLKWRRLRLSDCLTVAAFGFLATTARRHIPLAAFVCTPIAADAMTPLLARLLRPFNSARQRNAGNVGQASCMSKGKPSVSEAKPAGSPPPTEDGPLTGGQGGGQADGQAGSLSYLAANLPAWAGYALFVLVALAAAARPLGLDVSPYSPVGLTLRHFGLGIEEGKYPVRSAEFVAQFGPGGNIFNEYGDGNYLMWRLNESDDPGAFREFAENPRYLVFVDGRIDVYGERVMRLYEHVAGAGERWRQVLDEFDIGICIVPYARPQDAAAGVDAWPLADALWNDPDWSLVFWDDDRMVFGRRTRQPDGRARLSNRRGWSAYWMRPDRFDPATVRPGEGVENPAISELLQRVWMGPTFDAARPRELLGLALWSAGRFADAIPHLRRAHALQPDDARHAYHLGSALLDDGQPEEAAEWLRLAAKLRPQEPAVVWNALAYSHILAGDPARGARFARRAVRADPRYFRALLTLSLALEKDGRIEEARKAADRALQLAPDDPSAVLRRRELGDNYD